MKKLNLYSETEYKVVEIPVEFIDTFMPEASEEELKVYLYLLRAFRDPSILLSLHDMADLFDVTPKKVSQALMSWEEKGVLSLEYSDGELSGITVRQGNGHPAAGHPKAEKPAQKSRVPDNVMQLPKQDKKQPAPETAAPVDLSVLDNDANFEEILALAEYLMKGPVNWRLRDALGNCYLLFDKDMDIAEYLVEHCVEQGRIAPSYFLTVARNWKKEGLSSLQEIKEASSGRNKTVYSIKKALGIKNRELVSDELDYIESWTKVFDLPMILEACRRTVEHSDKPSFKYTDSILKAWENSGVKTLKDAEEEDEKFRSEKKQDQKKDSPRKSRKTSFHNFSERHTDFDALVDDFLES